MKPEASRPGCAGSDPRSIGQRMEELYNNRRTRLPKSFRSCQLTLDGMLYLSTGSRNRWSQLTLASDW